MGKKRITETEGETKNVATKTAEAPATEVAVPKATTKTVAPTQTASKTKKKTFDSATLHVQSTYNNTKALLTDKKGNALVASSAGALGFKGAKKGTPFAAAKVGEIIGDKAIELGVKEIDVVVSGVGSGRESTIRGFISRGIGLTQIKDVTPVPHNGPKAKKPRRV